MRIFADGAKVAKTAGRLLQGYGAEGIRGTERRAINDALAGLAVLGYSSAEIAPILKKLDTQDMTAEQIIRAVLKQMVR